MNSNIVEMIENLSRSLFPIQGLVSGLAYLLGIAFFITAIQKFRKIGDQRANSSGAEKMFVPTAYILGGVALLFLPTVYTVVSNTVFGVGNILSYTSYNPYDIYSSMILLIRTAGLIWFVRGSVLLTHASESGKQQGPKGMMFLFAGILSMNIETTVGFMNWVMSEISLSTLSGTSSS